MKNLLVIIFMLISSELFSSEEGTQNALLMTTNDERCSSNLRIRSMPSLSSSIIERIPCQRQELVKVIAVSEDQDWYRVSYNGVVGYSSARYLEEVGDVLNEVTTVNENLRSPTQQTSSEGDCGIYCGEHNETSTPVITLDPGQSPTAPQDNSYENIYVHQELRENFEALGGDPIALEQSLCFLNRHTQTAFSPCNNEYSWCRNDRHYAGYRPGGIRLGNQRYVSIQDLTKPGNQPRFYLLDLVTGKVEVMHSGHGSGLGNQRNGYGVPEYFSNVDESHLSSRGFFATGNEYESERSFGTGMRMHGLQAGLNDNTFRPRGVVMHAARYVQNGSFTTAEELARRPAESLAGRTWGCVGLGSDQFDSVLMRIQNGIETQKEESYIDEMGNTQNRYNFNSSLMYNYTVHERAYGHSYCGDHPEYPLMLEE